MATEQAEYVDLTDQEEYEEDAQSLVDDCSIDLYLDFEDPFEDIHIF